MFTKTFKANAVSQVRGKLPATRCMMAVFALVCSSLSIGCTALTTPIKGVPARRLPPQFFATPKNNLVPIDVSRLSQEPPREYLLDKGDILGIYIEGILPSSAPDQVPTLPPVHFPDKDSLLPPSLGFPVPVVEDGTISLPLIKPLSVAGLTVQQVRELIRRAYFDSKILTETQLRVFTPIVSLLQERSYNIVVVRQDSSGGGDGGAAGRGYISGGNDESATGKALRLKAYQNDVLHALMETGGLPGLNAKNEIQILRASRADQRKRDEFVRQFYATFYDKNNCNPCVCPPPLPDDPSIVKIPLRLPPGVTPSFRPEEIILQEGDIVYIESRDREVFYTGGLLPGGEWKIPRDYDLDVLGAMAIAGRGIASTGQGGGGGGGMGGNFAVGIGGVPPGNLYILRKTPCDGQVTIQVDLARAINNPRERPLIQPGDILILQYKCEEELLNFGLGTFFTFGIQQLFNGNQ